MVAHKSDSHDEDPHPVWRRHRSQLSELRDEFRMAAPWRHVVIDGFLPPKMAAKASSSFPRIGRTRTLLARLFEARTYGGSFGGNDPKDVPIMVEIQRELASPEFTEFVRAVTGIDDLQIDEEHVGAGFHVGARGSYLRVHADHNTHPHDQKRFRRVNLILYLHSEWQSKWNGDLELWDREAIECRKRIEPLFNRCVIMDVDDTAFHGYGPLRVPNDAMRCSLAAYYYSRGPSESQSAVPHGTILPPLPGESALAAALHRIRRRALARAEKMLRLLSGKP